MTKRYAAQAILVAVAQLVNYYVLAIFAGVLQRIYNPDQFVKVLLCQFEAVPSAPSVAQTELRQTLI